ncbi:hypothetical protein RB25_19660 [Herbaspirillum rubrisubalbicans]|uniref:Uncharacterized protein n=2 Tax=Herbaspirillum rubrisubalbicans TaxID=80842 RepID=A0ABX9C0A9_9BURK|nr:hypothetical protein [Herbaspirillum rubrisubalbicans]NQE49757.1 hypothetical protein [Herbaspirillum rubrisubalbicans]RAM63781.1 hypothetical protein RB24_14915 [Herbaspirillum rubrisubalbicans]RAN44756.1 hypothetical protein RB25_19660 [Herbaspirillum rubrisubalbicans]
METVKIKEILPYVGVDQVRFGMSPTEVAEVWGEPHSRSMNFLKQYVEYRGNVSTTYSSEHQLIEIGLSKRCTEARIKDIQIFLPPKSSRLTELLNLDKEAYEDVGIIVFNKLGISVTGFDHVDDDDVAISVFSRGHWDEDLKGMRAYRR